MESGDFKSLEGLKNVDDNLVITVDRSYASIILYGARQYEYHREDADKCYQLFQYINHRTNDNWKVSEIARLLPEMTAQEIQQFIVNDVINSRTPMHKRIGEISM